MADQIVITPASDFIEIQYFGDDVPSVELQGVGAPGPQGKQGIQGPQGKQGIQGIQGNPGKDAIVTPEMQTLHANTLALRDEAKIIKSDVVATQQAVNQTAHTVSQTATEVESKRDATEGLRAATELLRNEARAARDDTNAAKQVVVTLNEQTSLARDAAQTAAAVAEQHELGSSRHEISSGQNANRSEDAAVRAEQAADRASLFNPADYIKSANNGSDFANPAAVRENIGAGEKLETVSETEAKAGTSVTPRNWTAERVKQAVSDKAPLTSPALTGVPTAPTAAPGTDSDQIANTAFVVAAIQRIVGMAPEDLDTLKEIADRIVAGEGEHETLLSLINTKADKNHKHGIIDVNGLPEALDAKAPLASPVFTGDPTVKTQETTDISKRIASTEFVKNAILASGLSVEGHKHSKSDIEGLVQDLLDINAGLTTLTQSKAPLASPELTGKPTAPTPASGTSNTEIATTAFVATALNNGLASKAEKTHTHGVEGVDGLQAILDAKAQTSSPTLTGAPKAPTAAAGTNTTQIATTAFVTAAISAFSTNLAISGVSGLQAALDAKLSSSLAASTYETLIQAWTYSAVDMTADTARFPWVDLAGGKFRASWNDIKNNLQISYDARYAGAAHTHTIAGVSSLQEALDNKFSIEGGTVRGNVRFLRDGNTTAAQWIGGGNGDGATSTTNNLKLVSWYGIGLSPSIEGSPVPAGEYSHWFNTRNGDMGMRGSLTAAGNISAYSDERLKTDIETITDALGMISRMRGVRFSMNGATNIGVIAQEMKKVAPEVVHEGEDEQKTLSVSYGNIVGILIEAVKELKSEVNDLKRSKA